MSDSKQRITIEDFLVLGNAVPDELRDGRKTVCVAGYSKEHGLVRIYPVPPKAPMKRWNILEVPVERNSQDSREESWKIQGSKSEWNILPDKIRLRDRIDSRERQIALLDKLNKSEYAYDCIDEINSKKKSLGIITPKIIKCFFESREKFDPSVQLTLSSDEPFRTIKSYPEQPRILYRCSNCKSKNPHDQQVVEWGIYEWMRQNPKDKDKVWENLHIGEKGYRTSFLVGNQVLHRNSFLIISIFRHKLGVSLDSQLLL